MFITGETCDIHYQKKKDGLIGADILRAKSILGTAMRDMCNPTAVGT